MVFNGINETSSKPLVRNFDVLQFQGSPFLFSICVGDIAGTLIAHELKYQYEGILSYSTWKTGNSMESKEETPGT